MTHTRIRRSLLLCLLISALAAPPALAEPQQVAAADQLKSKAFEALKAGKFDLTNDYLTQAAAISKDPVLARMAAWTQQFEQQRQVFVSERHKEYEKAVSEAHLLQSKGKTIYAIEVAARAYLLNDDKAAFRREPWVAQLLAQAKKLAEDYETHEQWLRSLRIYSQLSAIEPEVPAWKDRLKISTRRIRLLAMYTPDELKHIQEADIKEREEVDAILHPSTRPATRPTDEEENQQRVKWQDTLKGVRMDMLREAIINAHANYFRSVSYQKVLLGGLSGLRVVITTPALQKAFPGLADANKRNRMLGWLSATTALVEKSTREDQDLVVRVLRDMEDTNARTVDLPDIVLVSEFADGAFSTLDPFSSIIWPSDWEEFQKTTKGEFSGVGIQIQTDESGNLKVVSPLEDSPAYRAGIKPDYIVTHINGKTARWMSLNQAVKLITGPPRTDVTLTIKDTKGTSKDYVLTRETIKVASVKGWLHKPGGGWEYLIDPEQKIGYLRMTNFTKTTSHDLAKAIEDMENEGARGIILDLRYNPGGLLNEATAVVDKFVGAGLKIVSTRPDRSDSQYTENSIVAQLPAADKVKLPLVVLVNQYSASASEIVSGALKDHHRALIVGERTFGKGSVQMLYPLGRRVMEAPESVLKLTTSHYYLPNGKCIHREENSKEWGVEPDVTIEMTPEQMRQAIDARQDFDVLRDKPRDEKKGRKSPLESDAQLAAALLLMRLQIAGGQI